MTRTPPKGSSSDRIGGGGAATSSGIRFEQQLGALFAAWILAGDRFNVCFNLGSAAPVWVRFETEAPVDDLLVKTTEHGYIAVQAKTTASLSEDIDSPLGKTVTQFVRHWLVARQGDGSMEWNRPLDPSRDRLVLAVTPQASEQVREDLPTALRLVSQPGGGALNQAQQRAYRTFCTLVGLAWSRITKDPMDDSVLSELARLVTVFTFDGEQADGLASGSLVKIVSPTHDAATVFTALSEVSGRLMKERGGGDLTTWRRLLAGRGVSLDAPPAYRSDIEALKRHSKRISESLRSYERIEVPNAAPLAVRRDCQDAVETAARGGPLLVIGEPGAGKSAVLNRLGRTLSERGADVLELAVDRYSVESLQGLSLELGLKHPILDVIEAWDGAEPAYLIIDALDATRGGRGEGVFRTLIEQVLELKGRWNVVASIRNFDLRMGRQFKVLFKGASPEDSLADPSFAGVRHIQVPPWSESEFGQLLQQSPALETCLGRAHSRLRDLAKVPFNTRLLSELISDGGGDNLDSISSQGDLLALYWEHRVSDHGVAASVSLRRVVQLMLDSRALRAPLLDAAGDDPKMIEVLCQEGVLVIVDGERWIQFRHHLLFDYAAARTVLQPSGIVSGAFRFNKAEALGLMLSPALGFVLREIWESESDHVRFWQALGALIYTENGDPIIRSIAGRLGAEFPTGAEDCLRLGDLAISDDQKAPKILSHVTGALVVRAEDKEPFALAPWAHLAEHLAMAPASVIGTLRVLLHILVERVTDKELKPILGRASRALLQYGLAHSEAGFVVRSAIDFVIDTYDTDIVASGALLSQLFHHDRLVRLGHEDVPAVCYKIETIGKVDPAFVTNVYRIVFGHEVTEDRQTRIGQSQILNLTSTARQDYEMARWSLGEYFPTFLKVHPSHAVSAVVNAVEGYVAREHPDLEGGLYVEIEVEGRTIRLREDHSYIWAHSPDETYGRDAEVLVVKLREYLKGAPAIEATLLMDILIDEATFAVFWSRMFLCATERNDGLLERLWPIAATEQFLVLPDTRKDAIDVVARGVSRRQAAERRALEERAIDFDFSQFKFPFDARRAFLERLFAKIGRENLVTVEARRILDARPQVETATNDRLFEIRSFDGSTEEFHWIEGLDRDTPENSSLIQAINFAKQVLRLEAASEEVLSVPLAEALSALEVVRAALLADTTHEGLRRHAEGIIGQGCVAIVARNLLSLKEAPPTPEQDTSFMALLEIAARSENPELDGDTEANFEKSASWSGPAARVEAAQSYWDLFVQRPDLYSALISRAVVLLSDPHPAVRMNALIRLGRIWECDRSHFWVLLADRLAKEPNLTIIEHVLGRLVNRLIHEDQARSLELLLALLRREEPGSARALRVNNALADKVCILWVTYESMEAKSVLDGWLDPPWQNVAEAKSILKSLRGAVVAGIGSAAEGLIGKAGLRKRAQTIVAVIVDAANARLARYMAGSDPGETATEEARECAQLIDIAGKEMFFAAGGPAASQEGNQDFGQAGLKLFLEENTDLLNRIGEYATPQTTYYLLQLVERVLDVDPAAAFDLAASFLKGARRSGYQHESLGVNLLVRLIGVFLADHKEIFENVARRASLVDCLETFLEAGWPAARRLVYRLPELIQ